MSKLIEKTSFNLTRDEIRDRLHRAIPISPHEVTRVCLYYPVDLFDRPCYESCSVEIVSYPVHVRNFELPICYYIDSFPCDYLDIYEVLHEPEFRPFFRLFLEESM